WPRRRPGGRAPPPIPACAGPDSSPRTPTPSGPPPGAPSPGSTPTCYSRSARGGGGGRGGPPHTSPGPGRPPPRGAGPVQVAEQGDLRHVVDELEVGRPDDGDERQLGGIAQGVLAVAKGAGLLGGHG